MVSLMSVQNMNALIGGIEPKRTGVRNPNVVPYQIFKAKDGYFVLAVGNDSQFEKLIEVTNLQELKTDRFTTNALRIKNQDELIRILSRCFSHNIARHWV